jgi:hypothetical protein
MGCVGSVPWFSLSLVELFGVMQQLDDVCCSNAMVFDSAGTSYGVLDQCNSVFAVLRKVFWGDATTRWGV